MKKIFLSSSFKDVANIFEKFESNLKGKTVTFIPTASVVEKVIFYVDSGRKALEKLGIIIDELEVSTANIKEIKTKLEKNDMIYVTGGNTFFLLQELKRTGADKIIINQVMAGKTYIGESAGSIIASPNIEYAKLMDSVKKAPNLENFDALKLVDFYAVPHHTNFPFKKAVEKIIHTYSNDLKLMPISNKQAILINNEQVFFESN